MIVNDADLMPTNTGKRAFRTSDGVDLLETVSPLRSAHDAALFVPSSYAGCPISCNFIA